MKWVDIEEAATWPKGTPWVAVEFLDGEPECAFLHFEHTIEELSAMGSNWSHMFTRLDEPENREPFVSSDHPMKSGESNEPIDG